MRSLKRPLMLGYVSTLSAILGNLVLLPMAYAYLEPAQIGLWFNYLTIFSFLLLLDFGVTGTATREFGKAWFWRAGARVDLGKFSGLLVAFKRIYFQIAVTATIAAILICTPYLLSIATYDGGRDDVLYSWPINCIGFYVSIRFLYLVPALRGMDRIEIVYNSTTLSKIVQVLTALALLELGFGIFAISSSFLVSIVFARVFQFVAFSSDAEIRDQKLLENLSDNVAEPTLSDLSRKVWKHGFISMSVFFQDKASIFYVSLLAGLVAAETYGLTAQMLGVLAAVSNVYYNSYQKKIIDKHLANDRSGTSRYLLGAVYSQLLILGGGGIALFFIAKHIFWIVHMDAQLVDASTYFVLLLYLVLFNAQLVCVNFLMISDDFSMVYPYLASALAYVVIVFGASTFVVLGIKEIVGIQCAVLLAFNGWYWPLRTIKRLRKQGSSDE